MLPNNSGVIEDPRSPEEKAKDYIAGAETAIKYEVRIKDGDWRLYLPEGERQSNKFFESSACTHFAPGKEIESQIIWLAKNNKLSPECMEFIKQFCIDPNDINSFMVSKRYAAITGENTPKGNYFQKAWDGYRKFGCIPHTMIPDIDSCKSWEEFHDKSKITGDMLAMGKKFLEFFDIRYDILAWDNIPGINKTEEEIWEEYLKQAPLNIRIPGHSTTLFNIKPKTYGRFDHYLPFIRNDDRNKQVEFAIRGIVTPRVPELPPEKPKYNYAILPLKGQKGDIVRDLQRVLIYEGFLKKDLDTGFFGDKTEKALNDYLAKHKDAMVISKLKKDYGGMDK